MTTVLRPRWLWGLPMTDDPLKGSWCSCEGTMPRERNSPMMTSGSRPRYVEYVRRNPLTYVTPGMTSQSSFSMAWTYLTRILMSSSTCWSVRLRRTRASRSVVPISNTVGAVLLSRGRSFRAGRSPELPV